MGRAIGQDEQDFQDGKNLSEVWILSGTDLGWTCGACPQGNTLLYVSHQDPFLSYNPVKKVFMAIGSVGEVDARFGQEVREMLFDGINKIFRMVKTSWKLDPARYEFGLDMRSLPPRQHIAHFPTPISVFIL